MTFRRALSYISLVCALLGVWAPQANASGQGLEISPPVIEVAANPGQKLVLSIKLRNLVSDPIVAVSNVDDFGAKGEDGLPQILTEEVATGHSLKKWVAPIPAFKLETQEQKTVSVTVNVPSNAEPGGHYAVVRFTPKSVGNEEGVSLSASIGTLVLIRVSGPVIQKSTLLEFNSGTGSSMSSVFLGNDAVTFQERIKNDGTVHIKPKGQIRITNSFGRLVENIPINADEGNVLPGSIRKFTQVWKSNWAFGRYTAKAVVQYEDGTTLGSSELSYWVLPYKLIGLGVLSFGVLLSLVLVLLRNYKTRILKSARRR